MYKRIYIDGREIGDGKMPYLVAEAGVNHEGNLDTAKLMIWEAAKAGAAAIKFQAYKANRLVVPTAPAYWDTRSSQYDHFRRYDTFGESEYEQLAKECHEVGITFLCTPFDLESVDFLEPLVPAFKVASADITLDFPQKSGHRVKAMFDVCVRTQPG